MKKSVLITGCSKGGIGDALAQEFHNKGLRVFATTRDLAKIERLRAMGREVFQLDVTSQESIRCTMSEVQKVTGGKLDFLVNNAGSGNTHIRSFHRSQFDGTYMIADSCVMQALLCALLDADLGAARKLFDPTLLFCLGGHPSFCPQV